MAESDFRTQLIAAIGAPLRSSCRLISCFWLSDMPSIGNVMSDEAPPEISTITKSFLVADRARSSSRMVASKPAESGTGCAASTTSIHCVGPAWP